MAILVDISVIPVQSKTASASKYVKKALEIIKRSNLKFYAAPSMTTIEINDFSELANLLKELYSEILGSEVRRMEMILKIDMRNDKENTIENRLAAIR
ncbi:MAG: MTH1187 family thiamine-binding protein [Candidatus Micrarchaeia archaeon]